MGVSVMNGSIRVSAKTVDDAITEALIQLGVTSDKLEYEVIEKGSTGFLGIGAKQAVIEARKKHEVVEKKAEEVKPVKETKTVKENKEFKAAPKTEKKVEKNAEKKYSASAKEVKETKAEEKPVRHTSELAKVEDVTMEAVEKFLKDTLNAMGMEVEFTTCVDKEGALSIEMKGENMGILIGKRGQTLDSLQYLANRVANKHQEGYVRVKLDTENYRARREETLKNLAKNIAYKVKRSRRPVSLEPMNPYERRIIHSALQNNPYVTTHSEGEEPYRKVVITLKK